VVQDAWLHLQRTDPGAIEDPRRWLTTVVARLSLDALGSARRRREEYVGQWLPEPVVESLSGQEPSEQVTGGGQISAAWKPLEGAERVARALLALERKRRIDGREMRAAPARVNGAPGAVFHNGEALNVMSFTVDSGKIVAIDLVRNPEKRRRVPVPGA
jgi:hypothetical protein